MSDADFSDSMEEKGQHENFHLFGRQKPVHSALGGGKRRPISSLTKITSITMGLAIFAAADILLWRNKQISGALLAGATVIWLLFEWIGYRLIPFICHSLILTLATLFLWSNLSFFVHKSRYDFPEVVLPEDLCAKVALLLKDKCNEAFCLFQRVASGKDLKKFLCVVAGLWIVSIVGSWFDFLTLTYMMFVMLLTMPLLYEKHEDKVDSCALKAKDKLKKQYSKLDEQVLQKLPKVRFVADNKQN